MPRIAIFLQDEFIPLRKLLGNWPIKKYVLIYLQTHFAIGISWYFVKYQFRLELLFNRCLNIVFYPYFIIILLFCIINAIWIVLFPAFSDDFDLTLRGFCNMDLIWLADIMLIFGVWLVGKGGLGGFNSTFGIK